MQATVMIEIEAADLFKSENDNCMSNVNWRYCMDNATFVHREACEFIIHAMDGVVNSMMEYGCTPEFISAYLDAVRTGAVRVLFYT